MSEISCPMCGRSNPIDEEVCQFCSARLKPIWEDKSLNQPDSSAEIEGNDIPEWLRSIAPSSQDEENSQDDSVPEWLQGLRDEVRNENDFEASGDLTAIAGVENLDERQVPDWLKDIFLDSDESSTVSTEPEPQFENKEEESIPLGEAGPVHPTDQSQETEHEESDSSVQTEEVYSESDIKHPLDSGAENANEERPADITASEAESQPSHWYPDASWGKIAEIHTASEMGDEISVPVSPKEDTTEADSKAIEHQESLSDDGLKIPDQVGELDEPSKPPIDQMEQIENSIPEEATFNFEQLEQDARLDEGVEKQEVFTGDLSWLGEIETDPVHVSSASEEIDEEVTKEEPTAEKADEFPDWLKNAKQPEGDHIPSVLLSESTQEEIPPAELPSWLKSLRPVGALDLEGSQEQEASEEIENAGPLAGFTGVLYPEPDILHSVKPPVYSQKLRISDTQQAHANLLAQLIQIETVGKPHPHSHILKSQSLLRMSIALVLFAVVIVSLLINAPIIKTPSLSSEVYIANNLVASLPPSQPVLLAVDYSPGYSNELESILALVIGQLNSNDATLTLVSTIPTGPPQAERLVHQIMGQSDNAGSINYTNLGFVPGGPPGLIAFAQNPKQVFPYDSHGKAAWGNEELQKINTIADYALIMVATENPEVARYWIEQVQPLSKNKPILMIVSAQNIPIVQPYYEAVPQQVQGLLGGISAAIQYEALLGQPRNVSSIWSPFIVSLTASVILIVIGSLINSSVGFFMRRKTNRSSYGNN